MLPSHAYLVTDPSERSWLIPVNPIPKPKLELCVFELPDCNAADAAMAIAISECVCVNDWCGSRNPEPQAHNNCQRFPR